MRMKFDAVTVIWGAAFVDMFLRVGLRSVVAAGNLPDLAQAHDVTYTIYTTAEDAAIIQAAPLFKRLRDAVNVRFSLFSLSEIEAGSYASHAVMWRRSVELARRRRAIVLFLIPDLLYAEGSLTRWARRFEQGFRAVYTPSPQVATETLLPEIEARFAATDEPIALRDHDVIDLLLRHLHPIAATMLRDAPRAIAHPEHDLRAVPGRGMVARVACSHPLGVDPSFFGDLRDFNPCDHLDRIAFEPCTSVSAEPLLKHVSWYYRSRPLDDVRISQLAAWWDGFAAPGCVRESRETYDLCVRADDAWRTGRRRAVNAGAFYRTQLALGAEIYRLHRALKGLQLDHAANLLATAVYSGRLRRRVVVRGRALLLVPAEAAFAGAGADHLWQWLDRVGVSGLLRLIRNHVAVRDRGAVGTADPRVDGWRTLSGQALEFLTTDVRLIGDPVIVGPFTVCVIDRVLWPDDAPEAVPPVTAAADASVGRAAPWARPLGTAVEALARALSGLPGGQRYGRLLARIPPHLQVYGMAATRKKIIARLSRRAERMRAVRWARVRAGTAVRLSRNAARAARYVESHGLSAAWSRVRWMLRRRGAAPTQPPSLLGVEAQQRLDEVRMVRGLLAAEQVLAHHESKVLADHGCSAPLALVRELLASAGERGRLMSALEAALGELRRARPGSAEVRFELGCLALDQERSAEAIAHFTAAAQAKVLNDDTAYWDTAPRRDPRAQAAVEAARALVRSGRDQDARAVFARALDIQPDQPDVRAEYGLCLTRVGAWRDAGAHFGRAMEFGFFSWCTPRPARDARRLTIGLLEGMRTSASASNTGALMAETGG